MGGSRARKQVNGDTVKGLNLKLSHKGLILVSVPLIFELVFLGVLAKMLADAEVQLRQEERARLIVSYMNEVSRAMEDSAIALARYSATANSAHMDKYKESVKINNRFIQELKELVKDRPEDLKTVKALEQTTVEAVQLLDKFGHIFRWNANRLERLVYLPKLYKVADKAKSRIDEIVGRYKTIELSGPAAREQSRQIIQYALMSGVVFNVVLALALAVFFARGITNRLKTLTDNSVRLARDEPLSPVLGGADEIADLDRVFHEMAQTLAAAKEKQREIDRLKQEFVAMISHDLRAPLTAIRGTLALLADGTYGGLAETGQSRVRTAEQNANRLISLINDLLDIERMEAGRLTLKLEDIPMAAVVEESIDSVRELADRRGIEWEVTGCDQEVRADYQRLVQLMVNLLSNAIKFSPERGKITVSAERQDLCLEVRVTDNGPGIPAEHSKTVFERFKQIESPDGSSKQGSGLGLAIARAIVDCHDGSIGVNSEEGAGSTFWFRIPL